MAEKWYKIKEKTLKHLLNRNIHYMIEQQPMDNILERFCTLYDIDSSSNIEQIVDEIVKIDFLGTDYE